MLQVLTGMVRYVLPPLLQLTNLPCARGIELSSLRCQHSTSLAFLAWIDPNCATLQVLNLYGQGIEARNRMLELILPGKIVFLRPRKVCFCCHKLCKQQCSLDSRNPRYTTALGLNIYSAQAAHGTNFVPQSTEKVVGSCCK